MKQELRCHAVLCPSGSKARLMAERLKDRLHQALVDFKKEKVWRQNARLSLANSTHDNPSMPYRKVLNSVSGNYRPPIERGKAAPKLKVIEEVIVEEDEDLQENDEVEQNRVSNGAVQLNFNERGIDCPTSVSILGAPQPNPQSNLLHPITSSEIYNDDIGLHSRKEDDQISCSTFSEEDSNVQYKRLSLCSDNISVVTTETTVILEPEMSVNPLPTSATPQVIHVCEEELIDVSNDPRPRPKPAPRKSLRKLSDSPSKSSSTANTSIHEVNIINGCELQMDNCTSSDGEDEDDEDVVTNYLDKMSIIQENRLQVVDPLIRANNSQSPDSNHFSTKSDSSIVGDNDEMEDAEGTCRNNNKRNDIQVLNRSLVGVPHHNVVESKISSSKMDQDTISDESGYSEDSTAISTTNCPLSSSTSPTVSIKVIDKSIDKDISNGANIITIPNTPPSKVCIKNTSSIVKLDSDHARASQSEEGIGTKRKEECSSKYLLSSDLPIQEDSTVHGVFISDFSTTERLKYLEKSRQMTENKLSSAAAPPDFLQNKIQEFVINI